MTQQGERGPTEELLHAARVAREWSRNLRAWSRTERLRSEEVRLLSARRRVAAAAGGPTVPVTEPDAVTLGDVSVVDLFVILVENHHLEVREAVRQLTMGMLSAGYPAESEKVSATDAMSILEVILGSGSG